MWECPDCGFEFDAERYAPEPGADKCPVCGEARLAAELRGSRLAQDGLRMTVGALQAEAQNWRMAHDAALAENAELRAKLDAAREAWDKACERAYGGTGEDVLMYTADVVAVTAALAGGSHDKRTVDHAADAPPCDTLGERDVCPDCGQADCPWHLHGKHDIKCPECGLTVWVAGEQTLGERLVRLANKVHGDVWLGVQSNGLSRCLPTQFSRRECGTGDTPDAAVAALEAKLEGDDDVG